MDSLMYKECFSSYFQENYFNSLHLEFPLQNVVKMGQGIQKLLRRDTDAQSKDVNLFSEAVTIIRKEKE